MNVFKIFPCAADKKPLIKNWQTEATEDLEKIRMWTEQFKERLAYWAIATGPVNDILALDVDVKKENGFHTIQSKQLPIPQTMSQKTRSGGAHYLFRYPKNGQTYGNKVGFLPGLDLRGAGGYIIHYGVDETIVNDAPAWLLETVNNHSVSPHGNGPVRIAPEIVQAMIQTSLKHIREAPQGESNHVLNVESFRLGQLVAAEGVPREWAEQALFQAAKERGKPDYEARATIRSGLDGGSKKPLTSPFDAVQPSPLFPIPDPPSDVRVRWTPSAITRHDLLNTAKLRRPQLFEDWSTEDIHITTADGGTGKTTLKLFEAICLALGERFLGFNCKQQGKTLFITGEDSAEKLAAMLGQIMKQMGLFNPGVGNNEKIETILASILIKKDSDLCLVKKDRATGFLLPNDQAMIQVMEAVEDSNPKMIVFDPIASFWGSEAALNDMNKAVNKFMSELVYKSHACVEMINHMGKQSSSTKDMTQFAGRGGTGLPSNARVSRVMHGLSGEEYLGYTGEELKEHQSAIICNVNKFTDGSPLYNKPFVILREGYLFERKNLTPQKAKEAERALGDAERVLQFIKSERAKGKYPPSKFVSGYFACHDMPILGPSFKQAVLQLEYHGHMGEKIRLIDNPDVTIKDKVYIVVDENGEET